MTVGKSVENTINTLAEKEQFQVSGIAPLAGGDINQVFLLNTVSSGRMVVKLNHPEKFPGMFEAEKEGLQELRTSGAIDVPLVLATGSTGDHSYLLMEYREQGSPAPGFAETFGKQLANLHRVSNKQFGFKSDNYIGSLPQQNRRCPKASEFYITQRLEPQFALARHKNFQLDDPAKLYKVCEELIPKEAPALIHGDLWSGNYLVSSKGLPCLIDPAVAYAPREMDLAMMKLFGGFSEKIFKTYNREFPLQEDFEERVPLWQLYYLLVHLNIFGAGYKNRVKDIIKRYS